MKRNGCPLRSPHPSHCLSLLPVTGLSLFSSQHLPQSAIIMLLVCLLSLDQRRPQCNSQVQSPGSLAPLTAPDEYFSGSINPAMSPICPAWWWLLTVKAAAKLSGRRESRWAGGRNWGSARSGQGQRGGVFPGAEAPGKCREQCRWIHWVKIRILQWTVGTLS